MNRRDRVRDPCLLSIPGTTQPAFSTSHQSLKFKGAKVDGVRFFRDGKRQVLWWCERGMSDAPRMTLAKQQVFRNVGHLMGSPLPNLHSMGISGLIFFDHRVLVPGLGPCFQALSAL